jgi:hypothetical protein
MLQISILSNTGKWQWEKWKNVLNDPIDHQSLTIILKMLQNKNSKK